MEEHNEAKKHNFGEVEAGTKAGEEINTIVPFGSLKCGIKESQKRHAWKEITTAVSSVVVDNRSPADIIYAINI